MDKFTINNNMEVMEYSDQGTPKDREFQKNGLAFIDKDEATFQSLLLKLYFRSRLWDNGDFKLVIGSKQLEIEKINMNLPLDICFYSPNQALEFIHKNQDLVDHINDYISSQNDTLEVVEEPTIIEPGTTEPVYDEEGNEEL